MSHDFYDDYRLPGRHDMMDMMDIIDMMMRQRGREEKPKKKTLLDFKQSVKELKGFSVARPATMTVKSRRTARVITAHGYFTLVPDESLDLKIYHDHRFTRRVHFEVETFTLIELCYGQFDLLGASYLTEVEHGADTWVSAMGMVDKEKIDAMLFSAGGTNGGDLQNNLKYYRDHGGRAVNEMADLRNASMRSGLSDLAVSGGKFHEEKVGDKYIYGFDTVPLLQMTPNEWEEFGNILFKGNLRFSAKVAPEAKLVNGRLSHQFRFETV